MREGQRPAGVEPGSVTRFEEENVLAEYPAKRSAEDLDPAVHSGGRRRSP
ncbi:hypothetical protein ACFYSJ_32015 [Streptomyces sp. NPDC005248]